LLNSGKSGQPVIIGYDARFLADEFALLCAKVLKANGIDCLVCERDTPTPVVAWEVTDKKAAGAIMLTASHNPPEYCGIKFIAEYGGPVFEDVTKKIEEGINAQAPAGTGAAGPETGKSNAPLIYDSAKHGEIEHFSPEARYLQYIQKFVDTDLIRGAGLKAVYDPMFGSGRGYLDKLLEKMGVKIEVIHNYRDVLFGGKNPEPTAENLQELSSLVVQNKAQVGLSNDGDADRFGFVDENGKFLNANQIISLAAYYLLKEKRMRGNLVRSVATTHMLDAIAQKFGMQCHEVPVGFKHIAKLMLHDHILIGGEESGGLSIMGHIPEKDGILAGILVVEMLAKMKMPLSNIYAKMENEVGAFFQDRINLHVAEDVKDKLINGLKSDPPAEFCGQKVVKVNTLDGAKIILADGSWFLARPSGTEPLVRVYVEASSNQKLSDLKMAVQQVIKAV
jgi:alpha-D-glucose phosphate-specific phosphoglucomutase